jgi:hypothetical protein
LYGSIVHKDVQAVELEVDAANKLIVYEIYINKKLLKKHNKYMELSTSTGIWGLWRFRRMLKKEGNLNFKHLLNQFVKEFCGPRWSVEMQVLDYSTYTDGFGDLNYEEERATDESADQQSDE